MNKVQAVQLKQAGLKTVVFNHKMQNANEPTYQSSVLIALYGVNGTNDSTSGPGTWPVTGLSDLRRIFKNDPDIEKIAGNPKSGKLQFGSGVLDVTLRNLSPDLEMEVDVYYGWFRRNSDNSATSTNNNPLFEYNNAPTDLITAGNTAISLGERGATLFDKPAGISTTGYHIHKKMKLILAPTQTTFLQHRDPKNHMIDWTSTGECGYAKKGLTFGMWVVFKPTTTASDDAVVTLGIGSTRKYSYAVVEDNIDRVCKNPPL